MKKLNNKKISLIVIAFVFSVFLVGSTLSFLTRTTFEVSNTFKKGSVDCEIIEQFDGKIKSSIKIKNNSNVAEYIRIKIVSNYIDDNNVTCATKKEDLCLKVADGWKLKNDIYYYSKPVNSGEEIELLREPLKLKSNENGNRQMVEVLANAVQAYPETAVKEAWSVNVENGEIQ